ncbi:nuclear transport factor 2 family protein, partial [Bradyrhizobium oligotrophicum]
YVRFSWTLGPDSADGPIQGTDFVELADGRIRRVTGFLDRVPEGA